MQSYKVFLNDRIVEISGPRCQPLLNGNIKIEKVSGEPELKRLVSRFLSGDFSRLILWNEDHEWLWKNFCNLFLQIPAAGGVVESPKGYLFIYRRGKWDLPKGKIEAAETPAEAALREVSEETGLKRITITGKLPFTWHLYQSPYPETAGEWVLKETSWYLMHAGGDETLVPETGEDIEQARWFARPELKQVLENTYYNLVPLIEAL